MFSLLRSISSAGATSINFFYLSQIAIVDLGIFKAFDSVGKVIPAIELLLHCVLFGLDIDCTCFRPFIRILIQSEKNIYISGKYVCVLKLEVGNRRINSKSEA